MKILVTGATGFIGKYVVEQLLIHGVDVLTSSRNEAHFKEMPWSEKVEYFPHSIGDVFDDDTIGFFTKADRCIHLAWDGLPNFKDPKHETEYLQAQFRFLSELIQLGYKKLSITGTCLEYGLIEGEQKEDLVPAPTTAYGIGKNSLRNKLISLQKEGHFELDWIRLYYMYGKGQHPSSLIPQLDRAIDIEMLEFNMSEGNQVRDYLPVEQVAKIIVHLSLKEKGCGIVNCCSGEPVKLIDFIHTYLNNKNKTIQLNRGYYPYPDYEPFQFWGSRKKLDKILHEEPSFKNQ